MKLIKVEESDELLKKLVVEVNNCQDAICNFIDFYEKYKLKESLSHKEEDMMLFQYDYGFDKEYFEVDMTRQFEIPNEDEYLQLSLTLYYKTDKIGEIESESTWSTDSESVSDWKRKIENTNGYKKVEGLKPIKFEINLNET